MRVTVLKQTGRNVAAYRRFHSSIDRAALPAPFPCLYRPFPCSPPLVSLPPFSTSPAFCFVPPFRALAVSFSPSIQRHISFFIRTSGYEPSGLLFSSLRPSVFIYPLSRFSTHPVFSLPSPFIPDSSPHLFLPSCLTFLGQMPRGYSFRRGITFIVPAPPFLASPFSLYSFVITR